MDLVQGIVVVCLFLISLCAIEHHFRRSRLPYICWMVVFGVGYGILQQRLLPVLPRLQLTPDVIMFIFLPLLIFDSARKIKFNLAREVVAPSVLLATLGILVSMYMMALPILIFTEIPWIHILFFTAIMSATDPVAVSAIFSQFRVPEKLKTMLEGESLLNDGTTVILFAVLSHRLIEGEALVLQKGIAFFFLAVGGAIVIGVGVGLLGAWLMQKWQALHDHFVGALLPLLIVYLVFCFTQHVLDISGVIAVMAATMTMRYRFIMRWKEAKPPRCEMEFFREFWSFLGNLANTVLFFMLGVEIGYHADQLTWGVIGVSIVALVFSRSAVVYSFGALFRLMRIRLPLSWQHVLNLGGLKGALSVALVLLIPREYSYRNTFLCAALVMSLFTLIANTLTMRAYLKKADLNEAG